MEMGHSITEKLVVHLVWIESLGKSRRDSGHVFEEVFPTLVCELVEFFVVPFQCDEGIALEELVWVELSNGSGGFKEDEVRGLAQAGTDPTVRLQFRQRCDSGCAIIG